MPMLLRWNHLTIFSKFLRMKSYFKVSEKHVTDEGSLWPSISLEMRQSSVSYLSLEGHNYEIRQRQNISFPSAVYQCVPPLWLPRTLDFLRFCVTYQLGVFLKISYFRELFQAASKELSSYLIMSKFFYLR